MRQEVAREQVGTAPRQEGEGKQMSERTCAGCAHSRRIPQSLGALVECRGGAPQLIPTTAGIGIAFPQVPAGPQMVCGLWIPQPVLAEVPQ
jgi:hypothetical protein